VRAPQHSRNAQHTTALHRHCPDLAVSTGSIPGNLTAIGTEYESFPCSPHAESALIQPSQRPTSFFNDRGLRPLALLENNGWRHQTLHYQLLALTNGVMSGSHDQLINQL
jgi:hypothetical protein